VTKYTLFYCANSACECIETLEKPPDFSLLCSKTFLNCCTAIAKRSRRPKENELCHYGPLRVLCFVCAFCRSHSRSCKVNIFSVISVMLCCFYVTKWISWLIDWLVGSFPPRLSAWTVGAWQVWCLATRGYCCCLASCWSTRHEVLNFIRSMTHASFQWACATSWLAVCVVHNPFSPELWYILLTLWPVP